MGTYPAAVAGETFANEDGSSRQAEIARCRVGEPVILIREPDNPHDSNCIQVLSVRCVQIGNIARAAGWIAERMDEGKTVEAVILHINRWPECLGVVLEVTV